MKFTETKLPGAYLVEITQIKDSRGFFARSWSKPDFENLGLNANLAQANVAWNEVKGTLRGMHFQTAPYAETKLVRCTRGAVYDVIVDLRPDSPTHKQWFGAELTYDNYRMLYIPEGFGHGYQTLTYDAELTYFTTALYEPSAAGGVRYNDPAFGIEWPLAVTRISDKDAQWGDYTERLRAAIFGGYYA
jgi:dTDP-4-dehydrorhamnose 3,5-epimerase